MELPKISKSQKGGMLEGLKSKLGMGGRQADGEYDEYYDDDYGYSDDYDDDYDDDYADDYDDGSATGYSAYSSGMSTPRAEIGSPRLISMQDVRQTSRYETSGREPVAPSGNVSVEPLPSLGSVAQPTMEFKSPYESGAQAYGQAGSSAYHSEGLNSLFTPSDSPVSLRGRKLAVYSPNSYNETEFIARSLKAGEAVVLSFRSTPDALMKRILDFSFGAASILEAQVECPGDKVFALTCGEPLTQAELNSLRAQGVL